MNQINIIGYATGPAKQYTSSQGTVWHGFNVVVNRVKGNTPDYFFCVAYENLEKIIQYIDKGKLLRVTGRHHCNNKEWSLVCNEIQLMPKSCNK